MKKVSQQLEEEERLSQEVLKMQTWPQELNLRTKPERLKSLMEEFLKDIQDDNETLRHLIEAQKK